MRARARVCMRASARVCMRASACVYARERACVYAREHVCVCARARVCVCARARGRSIVFRFSIARSATVVNDHTVNGVADGGQHLTASTERGAAFCQTRLKIKTRSPPVSNMGRICIRIALATIFNAEGVLIASCLNTPLKTQHSANMTHV